MIWPAALQSLKLKAMAARLRIPRFALEMIVALSLAFLVWLYIRTRHQESLDHVPIPVQISLAPVFADKYDLEIEGSRHINVSFIGPPSRIHELRGMLGRGEVRVNIPVVVPPSHWHESRYRESVHIHAGDVPAPPGVAVQISGGGNRIPITIRKLGEQQLAVRLDHSADERISQIEIKPQSVLVKGPQEILEHTVSVPTIRYHLPSFPGPTGKLPKELTVDLPLVKEMEGRPIQLSQASVRIRISLKPLPREFVLRDLPVRFLCPASFPFRPLVTARHEGKIVLRVKAPATGTAPSVFAYVDLTRGDFHPGLNVQPVRLQLPPDCQLDQELPEPLEFDLIPTEIASGWVVTEP
jgi:hypothetical protein